MSVIATTTIDNDEELYLNRKQWDQLRDKVEKGSDEESEEENSESGSDEESQPESNDSEEKPPVKDSDEETDEEGQQT